MSHPRKKILIFSSTAGGAHTAASHALTALLKDDYQVQVVNVLDGVLASLDVVRVITRQRSSAEALYNTLLRGGWTRMMNLMFKRLMVPLVFKHRAKFQGLLTEFLAAEQPDLLISVIPFINLPASDAAQALSIPYLLSVVDGDMTNYVYQLHTLSHRNFHLTIMKDNPILERQVRLFGLKPHLTIHPVGVPLRRQFFALQDRQALRLKHHIPGQKFVIMLMMGAVGGASTYHYARIIAAMNQDIHLVACVGRNTKLGKKLTRIRGSARASLTVQGFTKDIAEIMAIADLLITKPGPGSIQEAIKMELPMLIDNTRQPLFWERANIDMVQQHGIGATVDAYRHLPRLLEQYRGNHQLREHQKRVLRALSARLCEGQLKKVIDGMFAHAT